MRKYYVGKVKAVVKLADGGHAYDAMASLAEEGGLHFGLTGEVTGWSFLPPPLLNATEVRLILAGRNGEEHDFLITDKPDGTRLMVQSTDKNGT